MKRFKISFIDTNDFDQFIDADYMQVGTDFVEFYKAEFSKEEPETSMVGLVQTARVKLIKEESENPE